MISYILQYKSGLPVYNDLLKTLIPHRSRHGNGTGFVAADGRDGERPHWGRLILTISNAQIFHIGVDCFYLQKTPDFLQPRLRGRC